MTTIATITEEITRNGFFDTGFKNSLEDRIVIVAGYSDWGEKGFFLAERIEIEGRKPFTTPKMFYRDLRADHLMATAKQVGAE